MIEWNIFVFSVCFVIDCESSFCETQVVFHCLLQYDQGRPLVDLSWVHFCGVDYHCLLGRSSRFKFRRMHKIPRGVRMYDPFKYRAYLPPTSCDGWSVNWMIYSDRVVWYSHLRHVEYLKSWIDSEGSWWQHEQVSTPHMTLYLSQWHIVTNTERFQTVQDFGITTRYACYANVLVKSWRRRLIHETLLPSTVWTYWSVSVFLDITSAFRHQRYSPTCLL